MTDTAEKQRGTGEILEDLQEAVTEEETAQAAVLKTERDHNEACDRRRDAAHKVNELKAELDDVMRARSSL